MKQPFLISLFLLAVVSLAAVIDLDNLFPYEDQEVPAYITRDNTPEDNPITDQGATLGRVLFYDKNLSLTGAVACASCHKQGRAFGDDALQSAGINGVTGRHSMRLVNARFSDEVRFFWDERAIDLENQTTEPIQDHVEMGFSGENESPGIDSLINRLESIDYYPILFNEAFGNMEITEERISLALSQFVRSILSFDSPFDEGFMQVNGIGQPFPNYTPQENLGKQLFLDPPPQGGAGCAGCHNPPEFSIDPESLNNGIIGVAGDPEAMDLSNTKAPTLRDLVNPEGTENGPFMHDGSLASLIDVINHYNQIDTDPLNDNLDPRLIDPGGQGQNLNLSENEKQALVAFLYTLSGTELYDAEQWSDPFDEDGNLELIGGTVSVENSSEPISAKVYPNPTADRVNIEFSGEYAEVEVFDLSGKLVKISKLRSGSTMDLSDQGKGMYLFQIRYNQGVDIVKVLVD